MKRTVFILSGVIFLAAAVACSKTDELREGIDELNGRLDALSAQVGQVNDDLAASNGIINGTVTITGYSENEYGDYTVNMSDGGSLTVYSGKIEQSIPVFSVGEDGWTYTVDGVTYPMSGPDGYPAPASGATPQVRVTDNGRWEYSYDGQTWMSGFGTALPSSGSIFDDVYPGDDGNSLVFTWHSGDVTYEKEVALYGGLDFEIDYGQDNTPLRFAVGETMEFPVIQTNVVQVAIEPTVWGVKVTDDKITITAPSQADESVIVIKIFSAEGYARAVTVPVIAE